MSQELSIDQKRYIKNTLSYSPIREQILKFDKIEQGIDGTQMVHATALRHQIKVIVVFDGLDYFFSLTGMDRFEINSPEREELIINLLNHVWLSESKPDAIMHLLKYTYENKNDMYGFNSDFMKVKHKSVMASWVSAQLSKLHGYHYTKEHDLMLRKLVGVFAIRPDMFVPHLTKD